METVTVSELIKKYALTSENEYVQFEREANGDKNWSADHWKVCIQTAQDGRRKLTVDFYMGTGHNGKEPKLTDVLDSLRLDAEYGEMGFNEFCDELGYDSDSRKAEKTWKNSCHINRRLKKFFGAK